MTSMVRVSGAETATGNLSVDRRDFIRVCTLALAAVGMPFAAAAEVAQAIATKKLKPSVIWLHFQECTGCTESLLRTSHPAVSELILDLISLDYCETLFAAAGHQAEAALKKAMTENAGKYVLVIEGRDSDQGRRHLLPDRRAHRARDRPRGRGKGRGDHRDRLLRVVGRHSVGRPEPDRRDRRADGSQGQDRRDHSGMSGQPVQPARNGAPVRDLRHPARARREEPAEVRVRPHDPRAVPAPRPLRRRPLRREVRRRERAPGLLPLQAGVQGPRDPRQLLRPALRRSDRRVADRHRPSLFRVHRADVRDSAWPSSRRWTSIGPMPPDTYPPVHAPQGSISPVATGLAGLVGGALLGAGFAAARRLGAKPPEEPGEPGKGA